MTKKEFKGELKWIKPSRLIDKNNNNKIDNFFLVLASVFNDLKGIIFFQFILESDYRKPYEHEATEHSGEYGGLIVQTNKLLAGIINEFFIFIKENEELIKSEEFKTLSNSINSMERVMWNEIVEVACGRLSDASEFTKALLMIRNNMSFHYEYSGKNFRKAFIKRFFDIEKFAENEKAFYSLGDTMEKTRFYYSDAVIQQYIFSEGAKVSKDYQKLFGLTINQMRSVIMALLKKYLKTRPQRG